MAGFDSVFSVDKLRRHGYPETQIYEFKDAADCMISFFDRLIDEKIIPDPKYVISGLYSVDVKKRIETDIAPAYVKGRAQVASTIEETQQALKEAQETENLVTTDLKSGNVLTLVDELAKLAEDERKQQEPANF